MRKLYIFLVTLTSLTIVSLAPLNGFALENPEFGGNNAAEYQPPTGNPQNNTITGLQPNNNTGLQPAPSGINPQNLIQRGGLEVLTSTAKGATSTARDKAAAKSHSALPTWIAGGLLTLIAVVYVVFKPDPSKPVPVEAVVSEPVQTTKPKKKKSGSAKSTRKKRKAGQR